MEFILKKIINHLKLVGAVLLFTLICGCINVDYTGQHYPATGSQSEIAFYNSSKEVPTGKYAIIGRAVATAPDSYKSQAIKESLLAKAQACGADAIQVVDFKRIFIGQQELPTASANANGPVGSWGSRGTRADGSKIAVNSSGKVVPLQSKVYDRYKLKARVLFLRLKSKNPVQQPIMKKNPEPEVRTVKAPTTNDNLKQDKPVKK
jgi:hypothetical protein